MINPFGLTTYIAGGAVAAAVAWGGYQTITAKTAKLAAQDAIVAEARARGDLATCSARLANIQEAAESNAQIPDDLSDFDIPDHWMQPVE